MQKPNLGIKKLKSMMDGTVVESQQIISSDPDLAGLYRVRQYANAEEFHSKAGKRKWNLVMFRTVSENPLSKAIWDHPGIKPANIFKETENWLKSNIDDMLDQFIENEISKLDEP